MSVISMKALLESGVHFGHRTHKWHPYMKPYIFTERNGIHIIDLQKTVKAIEQAYNLVRDVVASGGYVLFVGTKRQARGAVESHCTACQMPYITERWLGGLLTNFRTVRERLRRLEELEGLVQTGGIKNYSKKMESQLSRELKKIHRNLNGVRTMSKLPAALVVIDVNREANAVREAKNLGIPTICLIDTDGDPDFADIPIPGNDDSMRSIDLILRELAAAVQEGKVSRQTSAPAAGEGSGDGSADSAAPAAPRRRSVRSRFRVDDVGGGLPADETPMQAAVATPPEPNP
jgi:small subunit ribosomal protein S2